MKDSSFPDDTGTTLQKIVAFAYKDYAVCIKLCRNKRVATFRICGLRISDAKAKTSNFIWQLKLHKAYPKAKPN